jgi:hypothetical protein
MVNLIAKENELGLDSNFYRVHKDAVKTSVDFKTDHDKYNVQEVHYFREDSVLQWWMRELYRSKGGVSPPPEFNGCNVLVSPDDLHGLQKVLNFAKGMCSQDPTYESKYTQLKLAISSMIEDYDEEYVYYYSAWY